MKSRTTLILAVVALLIGGLVWWDYKKGTTTEDRESQRKRLLAIKAPDVTGLELARTNQIIALEKSDAHWSLKKPLAVRADDATVGSILDELEFAERTRTLTDASAAEFGLDSPRLRVTLHDKKGATTLRIGSETPTKDAVFVQLEGDTAIHVVRKSIFERLDRSVADLRDRTVIGAVADSATRFEIKSADRVIELAKSAATTNAEPRWAIVRPLTVRADQQLTRNLLTDLSGLRVLDFVSEDPKDLHTHHLAEPSAELTVWTGAAETGKTLLLGAAQSNDTTKVTAKLKGADSIFTIAADDAKKFALQVNDLRDHRVLVYAEPDVRTIEVLRGADKIVVTRGTPPDGAWKLTAPVAVAADESRLHNLLDQLNNLTITQFVADVATDLDKYGLAAPAATVTLQGDGTNIVAQLLIGSATASNTWRHVKRTDEPSVYGIAPAIDWLPANANALRTRKLAAITPDQITKLTIQRGASAVTVDRNTDKKWKLVEPAQGVLDIEALHKFLEAFTQLNAQEFLADGQNNLAPYGLDAPILTVTATAGDKTYKLTVGKHHNDWQKYAAWSEPALVFTANTPDLAPLSKEIVTAATPPPPTPALPP